MIVKNDYDSLSEETVHVAIPFSNNLYSRAQPIFEYAQSKNNISEHFEMNWSTWEESVYNMRDGMSNRRIVSFGPKVELNEIEINNSSDSMESGFDVELFLNDSKDDMTITITHSRNCNHENNNENENGSYNDNDNDLQLEENDIIPESSSHSEIPSHTAIFVLEKDQEKNDLVYKAAAVATNGALTSQRVSNPSKNVRRSTDSLNSLYTNNNPNLERIGCCASARKAPRISKNEYITSIHSTDKKSTNILSSKSVKLNDSLSKQRKKRSLNTNESEIKSINGTIKTKESCRCVII